MISAKASAKITQRSEFHGFAAQFLRSLNWLILNAVSKTMQALVKRRPEPGLGLEEVPVPEVGPQRCPHSRPEGFDLRNRRSYI